MVRKTLNLLSLILLLLAFSASPSLAAPKKLLVVSVTTGFRHDSISSLKKMLAQLSQSTGEFTLDYLDQPPGKPAGLNKDATPAGKAAHAAAEHDWEENALKPALQKLAPAQLQSYDGVVFASTTGDLPLPDPQGFLDWIAAGHAFIGLHAATDTLHHWAPYAEMVGGEFDHHGRQVSVNLINADPEHPANAALPKTWTITQEEIYQFKKGYDPAAVHELLYLDKNPETGVPGHFPISWCKTYGRGRVFYTALGHRDDLIDPDPSLKNRLNSPEISKAYDAHVLGGIEWALGLKPGSSAPAATVLTSG
jgi:type 1 glutamine amidotransferase